MTDIEMFQRAYGPILLAEHELRLLFVTLRQGRPDQNVPARWSQYFAGMHPARVGDMAREILGLDDALDRIFAAGRRGDPEPPRCVLCGSPWCASHLKESHNG